MASIRLFIVILPESRHFVQQYLTVDLFLPSCLHLFHKVFVWKSDYIFVISLDVIDVFTEAELDSISAGFSVWLA